VHKDTTAQQSPTNLDS